MCSCVRFRVCLFIRTRIELGTSLPGVYANALAFSLFLSLCIARSANFSILIILILYANQIRVCRNGVGRMVDAFDWEAIVADLGSIYSGIVSG